MNLTLLDKLKTIFDLSKLSSIKLLNFNINIDKSININVKDASVEINPHKLNGKQRRALQDILRKSLDESGVILASDKAGEVDAVRSELPSIQGDIEKFQRIIPPTDTPLLHACLYLRQRHLKGDHVDDMKQQIARIYGQRGRNFANLCSAGYLEDWFLPLHQGLSQMYPDDPMTAKAKFLDIYSVIVDELPWTVFVCARMSKAKITRDIVDKIKRNMQNGIRFLNVHALGELNSKKTSAILPDILKETGAIAARMEQEPTRVFVRLEVP